VRGLGGEELGQQGSGSTTSRAGRDNDLQTGAVCISSRFQQWTLNCNAAKREVVSADRIPGGMEKTRHCLRLPSEGQQSGVRRSEGWRVMGRTNLRVRSRDVIQQTLTSPRASWLTHGSLAVLFAIEFTLILVAPFWVMLIPCILIHHRIGILLHEYMHGIPFRRYQDNLGLLTIANGLLLAFGFQEIFRGTHLEHHRWLNTDRDPGYWPPPKGGPDSILLRPLWLVYRSFVGDHGASLYVKHFTSLRKGHHPYVKPTRIAVEAGLSTVWLLFWIALGLYRVPLALMALHVCVWPPAAFRGTLEHSSDPGDTNFANEYRVRIPLFNMNRHIHHHIDPTCPWYRLEFKTSNPRPPRVYWTHWYHVFMKRDYVFMQPMPDEVRARKSRRLEAPKYEMECDNDRGCDELGRNEVRAAGSSEMRQP